MYWLVFCVLLDDEISQEKSQTEGEKPKLQDGEEEVMVNECKQVYLLNLCEFCELCSYYYIRFVWNLVIFFGYLIRWSGTWKDRREESCGQRQKDGDKEEEMVTSNMGVWIVWI